MRHQRHKRPQRFLILLPTKAGEWRERRITLSRYDLWAKLWRTWWHRTGWKRAHSPEMWAAGPIKFREAGWPKQA